MPGSFFDSNVVLYLVSADAEKAARAREVVLLGGTISVQVLNEVANVARRRMRLSWTETHDVLQTLQSLLSVVPISLQTHESGLALAERYGLSTYDAMIVASALLSGCDTLWSEDMQNGLSIENVLRIRNPFQAQDSSRE